MEQCGETNKIFQLEWVPHCLISWVAPFAQFRPLVKQYHHYHSAESVVDVHVYIGV